VGITKERIRLSGTGAGLYESSEIFLGHMKSSRMVSDVKKWNSIPSHFKH
jgi:hypothetical protein